MPTIRISGELIAANLKQLRNSGQHPTANLQPPIHIIDTAGGIRKISVFGLHMSGPAEVVYKPKEEHPLEIITASEITPKEALTETPRRERGKKYVFIRLGWYQGNQNPKRRDGPHLPVLTVWCWRANKKRFAPEYAFRLQVQGKSLIKYSLEDKPLIGGKDGPRLWVETLEEIIADKWYLPPLNREDFMR